MQKRGQVTIVIIIGILLTAAIGATLYFTKVRAVEELSKQPLSVQFITPFVENCLEKSTIDALYIVFAQGGYYQYPLDAALFQFAEQDKLLQVPVYFQKTEANLPSLSTIEKETAKAAEQALQTCVGKFEPFLKQGYLVQAGTPKIELHFSEKTLVTLHYPLTIHKRQEVAEASTFSVDIPFNFKEKYFTIAEYLKKQEEDPDYFLVGDLSAAAYEGNDELGFKQFGDSGNEVLVTFSYDDKLKAEPLNYNFALLFGWELEEAEVEIGTPSLQLFRLPEWEITTPGTHTFQVQAAGEELVYDTDPDSLPIDTKTGVITLNADDFPNDRYLYYVIVTDVYEQRAVGPFIINVNITQS